MIDLRSDAITQPTPAMWDAMSKADLGWALVGDDPTVNKLETYAAELAGKETSLFVPTGTIANLIALMSHTQRGNQVIIEASSHILWCEEWSFAYICGIAPRAIPGMRGQMDPGDVEKAIVERSFGHRPKTGLVCLENTHNVAGGAIIRAEHISAVAQLAHRYEVPVHLDGARIFNACVALQKDLQSFLTEVDTVTINLNKGLSAPFGAVLCGPRDFIELSQINLKRIGAANIHQAGIFAAAGLVALQTMIPQLAEDNRRAQVLSQGIMSVGRPQIRPFPIDTNIVMVAIDKSLMSADSLVEQMAGRGVLATSCSDDIVRFVTHRHISDEDIQQVVDTFLAAVT